MSYITRVSNLTCSAKEQSAKNNAIKIAAPYYAKYCNHANFSSTMNKKSQSNRKMNKYSIPFPPFLPIPSVISWFDSTAKEQLLFSSTF